VEVVIPEKEIPASENVVANANANIEMSNDANNLNDANINKNADEFDDTGNEVVLQTMEEHEQMLDAFE
jgi:hypothetical protein